MKIVMTFFIMLTLGLSSGVMADQSMEPKPLWVNASKDDGGIFKDWLIERSKENDSAIIFASTDYVSVFALTESAFGAYQEQYGVVDIDPALANKFFAALTPIYAGKLAKAGLKITENGWILWSNFGAVGRQTGGLPGLSTADVQLAIDRLNFGTDATAATFEAVTNTPVEPAEPQLVSMETILAKSEEKYAEALSSAEQNRQSILAQEKRLGESIQESNKKNRWQNVRLDGIEAEQVAGFKRDERIQKDVKQLGEDLAAANTVLAAVDSALNTIEADVTVLNAELEVRSEQRLLELRYIGLAIAGVLILLLLSSISLRRLVRRSEVELDPKLVHEMTEQNMYDSSKLEETQPFAELESQRQSWERNQSSVATLRKAG